MKRSIESLSFPSPDNSDNSDSSEVESEYISGFSFKRTRALPQNHDFIKITENSLFETIDKRGYKSFKKYEHTGKFLILIFFGTRTNFLDPINDHYQEIKSLNSEIIGVSSNLTSNEFDFTLINSSRVSKSFNVLDPIGGGVYPRDVIIIFDSHGNKRFEIPITLHGKFTNDRPIIQILLDSLEDLQSEMML